MRIAVLASGRGSNLQALIEAWRKKLLPVQFVGVGSDNPVAPALDKAEEAKIPTRAFPLGAYEDRADQERAILNWVDEISAELLVLAGYMRVLSPSFIRELPCPVINIHPALLPSFPGLHAQRQAVEYGVKVSGCTVHFVDEGMDSGPIILQQTVPVFDGDTEETLADRILIQEHQLLPEAVRLMAAGRVHRKGRQVRIDRDC